MSRYIVRHLLCGLCLALTLAACDAGPSDLEAGGDPPGGDGPPAVPASTCSARIDGEMFTASTAGATTSPEGETLDFSCSAGSESLVVRVQPEGFDGATLPLGTPGHRAQYSSGSEVAVTVDLPNGEPAGEVVLTTFTRSRAVGTFWFNAPGFSDGDPVIRVTAGRFDLAVN